MSMKQLLTLLAAAGGAALIGITAPVYATEHSEGTPQPPQVTEESAGQVQESPGIAGRPGESPSEAQESPGVAGRPGEAMEGAADPAATESR